MSHSTRVLIVLLILFAFLLQACAGSVAAQPQVNQPGPAGLIPVSLKVVALPFLSYAPFFIAAEEGYYAEQALQVELVNMTQNQDIIPALVSNQVDVISGLFNSGMFNAIARGGQIKFVADKGYIDPDACSTFGVVARRSLAETKDLSDPDNLRGLKFDALRASWMQYYLEKELATVGLSMTDIEPVQVPTPSQLAALDEGALDVTTNADPWITRFVAAGHQSILTPVNELMPGETFGVVIYGPNLLGENAAVGNRFMAAYLKAVRQYNEGKTDRNIAILAKHTQLEPDLLRAMCWPGLRNDGGVDMDSILAFQDWAVASGLLEQTLKPEQFWDGSFIESANKLLATAGQ